MRQSRLTPDEIVRMEVEIWPTSTVFNKSHRIPLAGRPACC
jgi:hypothetical protein